MKTRLDETNTDLPVITMQVGEGSERRDIAVRWRPGRGRPVVWLGGFRSDMRATKAMALDAWAERAGRPCLRFDYSGHGESSGAFEDGTISAWLRDASAVIERFADDHPVLVGSSMGGWIACLAALERLRQGRSPASGLVLIAPAVDFTEILMWQAFPAAIRAEIERNGVWYRPTEYDPNPNPITLALIEDGRRNGLLDAPFDPGCPIHILQGMRDPDVPYTHALRILERLPPERTLLTLVADGDHRLSRDQDIALLLRSIEAITHQP